MLTVCVQEWCLKLPSVLPSLALLATPSNFTELCLDSRPMAVFSSFVWATSKYGTNVYIFLICSDKVSWLFLLSKFKSEVCFPYFFTVQRVYVSDDVGHVIKP